MRLLTIWENIIKNYSIKCKSFDIKPLNENVKCQDFYNFYTNEDIFIIGNPPFSQLKEFINKSLTLCDECYFLGGSMLITGGLSNKVNLLYRFEGQEGNQKDKRTKIKFIDSNDEDLLVWCCGACFDNKNHNKFERSDFYNDNSFRISVKKYCNFDERVIKL